jgi:cell wall-associated NlpC family hydrolase
MQDKAIINVSVANIYREASYRSEVITQGLLNERVDVIERDNDFSKIILPDGYPGWINNHQLCDDVQFSGEQYLVVGHFCPVLEQPDDNARQLVNVVAGSRLNRLETAGNWLKIQLPDQRTGWIEKKNLGEIRPFTQENLVEAAMRFLGYPYHWGGRTPVGFDCSGLVQTVFALHGKKLRRDAWMQHEDAELKSTNPCNTSAGELYFFAEKTDRITHVGIALGDCRIIHARGRVRINSLREGDADFSENLLTTFVDTRSYFSD